MKQQIQRDVWVCRIVVVALGLSVLASLLAVQDHSTPELLVAIGSVAVGGRTGLLAPSPLNR